jgi:Ca2+-transporting ATPase
MSDFFSCCEQNFTRLSERPFSSEHKYMAVSGVHNSASSSVGAAPREMYYIKGSIEAVLDRCRFYYVSEESTPGLDANTRNVIVSTAGATAARGLRVIAMAYGYGPVESSTNTSSTSSSRSPSPSLAESKTNLVFVGYEAMLDPPRKGVGDAIGLLQAGGVHVVMITGDAEATAMSIARKLGLRVGGGAACLTGTMIDGMSRGQLRERVGSVSVFARTTPGHKMAIVEAFQAKGDVVAMTGDGGECFCF